MRCIILLSLLASAASASLLDSSEPVTMDPAELSRIWQEVKTGKPAPAAPASDFWAESIMAQDAELARVYLLLWLQKQNPLMPLELYAHEYAAALSLHREALAGNSSSCAVLAAAYRAGRIGGLILQPSEQKARWFEQRALNPENIPN